MRSTKLLALVVLLLLMAAGVAQAEELEPTSQEMPGADTAAEDVAEPQEPAAVPEEEAAAGAPEPGVEAWEPGLEDAALPADLDPAGQPEADVAEAAGEELPAATEEEELPAATEMDASGPPSAAEPGSQEQAPSVTVATPDPDQPAQAAEPEVAENGVVLGQVGYDSEGREGRIHLVVRGDTLWDISDAYLGTPWVWPSVWQDNRNIENPHLIYPGDRIWITDGEMRVVSREEAEALLAGAPAASDPAPFESVPGESIVPAAPAPTLAAEPRTQRVSTWEGVGFVTADAYESAASIVDSVADKVMLSQGDPVYVGLGAGDVVRGDQFTVFRKRERVFDPDTGRLLGYHVDMLGWLEVDEPGAEASLALIRKSDSEIERGDRITRRQEPKSEIAILPPPRGVDAKISFFAKSRTMMAMSDYVYLNRGTLDGLDVGSPLEVYRPSYVAREEARHTRVEVPDRVIAQLLVVKADSNSAVAFVTQTELELELGDHVRGASR